MQSLILLISIFKENRLKESSSTISTKGNEIDGDYILKKESSYSFDLK